MSPEQWERLETAVAALMTPPGGADAHLGGLAEAMAVAEASEQGFAPAYPEPEVKLRPGDPFGDWRLVREIDGGPLGTAWLAEGDESERRQVVVKFVPVSLTDPELRRQFAREIRLLARLQHPAIAELVDAGMGPGGNAYFILEAVEGTPINEWTDEPLTRRVDLMVDVVRAVQFAHSQLVLHLDLQPSRVLITPEGQPKLLEFGLARLESEDLADPEGRAIATAAPSLEYASPEQLLEQEATAASDVYSLGLIAFELFTGQPARTWTELPGRQQLLDAETWALPEADLPSDLRRMLERAAHPDPARRYESASAFAEDLARFASGEVAAPSPVRTETAPESWVELAQRYRMALIGIAVVLVVLAAVAVGGGWQAARATRQSELATAQQRKAEQAAAAQAVARQAAERARDQAVASRLATLRQRDAANARLGEVLDLSHATLDGTYRAIRDLPGANAATAGVLRQTVATIEAWEEPEARDPRISELLADAYAGLAGLIGADSTRPGELREAWTLRQKEIALRTRLIEQTRVKPSAERYLAEAHLDHWLLSQRLGQPVSAAAITSWEGAWGRWLRGSPRNVAVLCGRWLYSFCLYLLFPSGRPAHLNQAIRYWEQEQKLSGSRDGAGRHLALAYRAQAALPGAGLEARLASLTAARKLDEKRIEANPSQLLARRELALDLAATGDLQIEAADYAAAATQFRSAAEHLRTLATTDPAELQRPLYLNALRGVAVSLWKAQEWAALTQEAVHWRRMAAKDASANDQALAALIEGDLAQRRRDPARACEAWAAARNAAAEAVRSGLIFVEAEALAKRQSQCP